MRALRKDRSKNLKRSSSVWMMINLKLVLGSIVPVCSSNTSIYSSAPQRQPEVSTRIAGGDLVKIDEPGSVPFP